MAFNGENAEMEKSDLTLSTFVQYVEDFRFWVNAAERCHRSKRNSKNVCHGAKT